MPEPPTSDFGEPRPAGPRPDRPEGEGSGSGGSSDSLLGRRLGEVVDRAVGAERLQRWEDRVLRGTVGEWKVEELLDCGGQGAVFRGKRVFTDDPSRVGPSVAIKVVEPNDGGELAHDLRR